MSKIKLSRKNVSLRKKIVNYTYYFTRKTYITVQVTASDRIIIRLVIVGHPIRTKIINRQKQTRRDTLYILVDHLSICTRIHHQEQ